MLLLLLHLYILRARSSLWNTFYEKKYHIHISQCLPLKNFPCCCSQHTFRLWCECMGVYIWETETFIWFLQRNGKSLPPWRANRVGGKIPNTQFRVIIFLSTTIQLRPLLQLYYYYNSSRSDNVGKNNPPQYKYLQNAIFQFYGIGLVHGRGRDGCAGGPSLWLPWWSIQTVSTYNSPAGFYNCCWWAIKN